MLQILIQSFQGLLGLICAFSVQSQIGSRQTILARADTPELPAIASVQTSGGISPVVSLPTKPAPEIAVVVLVSSISGQEWPQLSEELTALYQALRSAHPVTLLFVRDQNIQSQGPFKSRVALQTALLGLQSSSLPPLSFARRRNWMRFWPRK